MTFATTILAAALVVPSMPPPEYADCEVVTNCVFEASRNDAKEFTVRIELDATPSNGVEVVFGRDADGDGVLSRTEEAMSVGYDCGEWKVVNPTTGDAFSSVGTHGYTALGLKLRLDADRSPRSLAATVNCTESPSGNWWTDMSTTRRTGLCGKTGQAGFVTSHFIYRPHFVTPLLYQPTVSKGSLVTLSKTI